MNIGEFREMDIKERRQACSVKALLVDGLLARMQEAAHSGETR